MKWNNRPVYFIIAFSIVSCVGEDIVNDYVAPELRIENPLLSLGINETYQFRARYLNNIGQEEQVDVRWSSNDTTIITIEENSGLAIAKNSGTTLITATTLTEAVTEVSTTVTVNEETVEDNEVKSGTIESTSSYTLRGDFIFSQNDDGTFLLSLADNYKASASLPGLYVYLTNNPNSINDAFEIGAVNTFEGAHSYILPETIKPTDFNYLLYWCKPFSVKVGGGDIN